MNLEKLNSPDPKVKYGFAKELLKTAAEHPERLYENFSSLAELTKSKNNILKWTGIDIIGYLSQHDPDGKTEEKIPELINFLHGGHLITCNHAIFALSLIARHKPQYKEKILSELLKISGDAFDTDECKNIATGKVIEALDKFFSEEISSPAVMEFAGAATGNSRSATRKKAEKLMRKARKNFLPAG